MREPKRTLVAEKLSRAIQSCIWSLVLLAGCTPSQDRNAPPFVRTGTGHCKFVQPDAVQKILEAKRFGVYLTGGASSLRNDSSFDIKIVISEASGSVLITWNGTKSFAYNDAGIKELNDRLMHAPQHSRILVCPFDFNEAVVGNEFELPPRRQKYSLNMFNWAVIEERELILILWNPGGAPKIGE